MLESTYVKIAAIYDKLKKAENENKIIYISGALGFGKTAAVAYYFRTRKYLKINGTEGYLTPMPSIKDIKESIIVFDDISWINDEKAQNYILDVCHTSGKQIVIVSRSKIPPWLAITSVELNFITAQERDFLFDVDEIRTYFSNRRLSVSENQLLYIKRITKGHALTLKFISQFIEAGHPINNDIIELTRTELFKYYDYSFFNKWSPEFRRVIISMCHYKTFTADMAEIVTGNNHIPEILNSASLLGTFIIIHENGVYEYRPELTKYLNWKWNILYNKEQTRENYLRGALHYEIHDQVEDALYFYSKAECMDKLCEMLEKNSEKHPGMAHYFETRKYYLELPREKILASPVLMCGMSMLHSILLQPDESEEWYDELVKYEKNAPKGSQERKDAKRRIAFLDIALAHRGIHNIIQILKNAAILSMSKNIKMPEFSVTSNLPSIMNGGLDFSDWSKSDKELAVVMKKPIEFLLGKYSAGLVNIALSESGFEKNTMDDYEIMTKLNSGYLMAETNGKIEMCFASTGLMVRLHVSKGQIASAQKQLSSFKEKVIAEKADQLINNIETMETWLSVLQGDNKSINKWLKKAPDENKEFYVLERYRYINKVRCLITLGNYSEAICLIERLNFYFTSYERHYMWIQNQLLKAIVQFRIDSDEWMTTLEKGLQVAEYYHFVRVVAEEGIAIKKLLDKFTSKEISKEFMEAITVEVGKMAIFYPNYLKEYKLLKEELTDMEQKILRLLCDGVASKETCDLLNISYNTLKFHKKNIYRKLGTKNRQETEIVASNLGLYMTN